LFSGLSYGPKAKKAITTAVAKAPQSFDRLCGARRRELLSAGAGRRRTGLAIADFRKAIELDARMPMRGSGWGWRCVRRIRTRKAQKAFARSLQLNPNRVWAKQQIG
jgi:hypothetical protein